MHAIRNTNILVALVIYIETLKALGREDDLAKWKCWNLWQIIELMRIIVTRKCCLNRCRGGSKTRDMSALYVFFCIRYGGSVCYWIASSRKQLNQLMKYLAANPYVLPFSRSIQTSQVKLVDQDPIEFVVLNPESIRGPRAKVLFFDEVREMNPSLYEDALMISNGMGDKIWWIHFSTPLIASKFQELCDIYPCFTRTCYECDWFTMEQIEDARKILSPAKFSQEMLCMFTAMDGVVFEVNLHAEVCPYDLMMPIFYGNDSNPRNGYCVVGIQYSYDGRHSAVCYAKNFGPSNAGKSAMVEFLLKQSKKDHVSIEHENNGAGMPVGDELISRGCRNLLTINWTDKDKMITANTMRELDIWIGCDDPFISADERNARKVLFNQMSALCYAKSGDAIAKNDDQEWHMNDAAMHAHHKDSFASIDAF